MSQTITDMNNSILAKKDLIMLIFDNPIEHPASLAIYDSYVEDPISVDDNGTVKTQKSNTLKYYPLNEQGLEVAKTQANISQSKMHREEIFTVTNIAKSNLLKVKPHHLNEVKKLYYDAIIALL